VVLAIRGLVVVVVVTNLTGTEAIAQIHMRVAIRKEARVSRLRVQEM
jgi:hypothetical protein